MLPIAANWCKVLPNIANWWKRFAECCQVLPSVAKYCQVLPVSQSTAKCWQLLASVANYCQVTQSVAKALSIDAQCCSMLPSLSITIVAKFSPVWPSVANFVQVQCWQMVPSVSKCTSVAKYCQVLINFIAIAALFVLKKCGGRGKSPIIISPQNLFLFVS